MSHPEENVSLETPTARQTLIDFWRSAVEVDENGLLQFNRQIAADFPNNFFIHDALRYLLLVAMNLDNYFPVEPFSWERFNQQYPLTIKNERLITAAAGEETGNLGLYRQFLLSKTFSRLKENDQPTNMLLVGALGYFSLQKLLEALTHLGWTNTNIDIVDPVHLGLLEIELLRGMQWHWKGKVRTITADVCALTPEKPYELVSADLVANYAVDRYDQHHLDPIRKYIKIVEAVNRLLSNGGIFLSRTSSFPTSQVLKQLPRYSLRKNAASSLEMEFRRRKLIEILGAEIFNRINPWSIDMVLSEGPFHKANPEPMCGLAYLFAPDFAKATLSFEDRAPRRFRDLYKRFFTNLEELRVWDEKKKRLFQTWVAQKQ